MSSRAGAWVRLPKMRSPLDGARNIGFNRGNQNNNLLIPLSFCVGASATAFSERA